ncbi:MAG: rod shape-determining protein MreC [Proteobacteria bacterium]|nr:rod shape-determining protein MreC [Pseudomonadota bacterium]
MNSFVRRYQIILLSIIFCLFSLNMALSEKKTVGGAVFIEKTISKIFSPFQMAFLGIYNITSGTWEGYVALVGLRDDFTLQQKRVLALVEENNRLKEVDHENQRLREILSFKEELSSNAVGAKILAFNLSGWTKTIKLNKGATDGIVEDMPVISPTGVIGRIISTTSGSSTALLITDPRSNIDVIVQRTRVRGVAEGNGQNALTLKYIRDLDDVKKGDKIITAGFAGIFPSGLVVGEITRTEKSGDNFFKRIEIKPNAALKKLEEVLIGPVTNKEE